MDEVVVDGVVVLVLGVEVELEGVLVLVLLLLELVLVLLLVLGVDVLCEVDPVDDRLVGAEGWDRDELGVLEPPPASA